MRVVVVAGAGALALTLPLTVAIVAVLAIVVISYQQTIRAYPSGGGSYIVASDNLGRGPGLVAAAALLTDYVLTVAVSVAAGVAALTSIFPGSVRRAGRSSRWRASPALWLGNLRGIRESATIFAVPDLRLPRGDLRAARAWASGRRYRVRCRTRPRPRGPGRRWTGIGLFLILRAFAAGSVALTGTEAVSNGVPAFRAAGGAQRRRRPHPDGPLLRLDLPGRQLPGRADRDRARSDRAGDGDQPGDARDRRGRTRRSTT